MSQRLDITEHHEVSYCVPIWVRDEQVRINTARVTGRIERVDGLREEPIAVVCYGPSLNETWEQVRGFSHILTCSGAHKFLIDRGIVPTYHIDVDPRLHKLLLLGDPHPDVQYLISSTCHPAYLDKLQGYNVKLWHVFSNEAEAMRVLPPGEWALTGGSSVGLRALTIAAWLGYRELHVFGMDGCEGPTGKHAADHPMQPKDHQVTEYEGVEYRTTVSMLECAKQTWHELDQLPGVTARFYGEGLVQAMAKNYVPKPIAKEKTNLGIAKPALISAEYRDLNARLHDENMAYGVGGAKHAATVLKLVEATKARSVLDYGCGKGYLAKSLPFGICEYDPCIPGKENPPRPADLVVCTDVLEHIEPERLNYVLADLRRVTLKVGYFVIHTGPAGKTLADGRNTHLIQHGRDWWAAQLREFFHVPEQGIKLAGAELHVVVAPEVKPKEKNHGGLSRKKGRTLGTTQATR